MASPNPHSSPPVAVDQRRLQFTPVDLPLTSPRRSCVYKMADATPEGIVDITSLTEAKYRREAKKRRKIKIKSLATLYKDDIERQTCTTSEGDYGGQTSMPVYSKLPQQPCCEVLSYCRTMDD
ncbi:hypothetical protein HAX54_006988 [Datura stramonium]|uniref:Uncharacterized protein n=1 Tax=Datura stramonium TaxID=4076 RepID=A0ABS8TDG8_DATST|nr:hypothetical protein [Datura stramonium]